MKNWTAAAGTCVNPVEFDSGLGSRSLAGLALRDLSASELCEVLSMRYRELSRRLSELGCAEVPRTGGGSHRKWHNPATGGSTVVPDHGPKDLKLGTVRAVVHQLGIDWREFDRR